MYSSMRLKVVVHGGSTPSYDKIHLIMTTYSTLTKIRCISCSWIMKVCHKKFKKRKEEEKLVVCDVHTVRELFEHVSSYHVQLIASRFGEKGKMYLLWLYLYMICSVCLHLYDMIYILLMYISYLYMVYKLSVSTLLSNCTHVGSTFSL
jgi:hypothetical protein